MAFIAQEWLLIAVLLALVTALVVVEGRRGGQSINIHEATRLLNKEDAVLLDVRDAGEYKNGHIVNAINIPHARLSERMSELDKYKNKTIIIADKFGQHSGHCGKQLKEKGFDSLRMQGGMSEWLSQNLPVAKS